MITEKELRKELERIVKAKKRKDLTEKVMNDLYACEQSLAWVLSPKNLMSPYKFCMIGAKE